MDIHTTQSVKTYARPSWAYKDQVIRSNHDRFDKIAEETNKALNKEKSISEHRRFFTHNRTSGRSASESRKTSTASLSGTGSCATRKSRSHTQSHSFQLFESSSQAESTSEADMSSSDLENSQPKHSRKTKKGVKRTGSSTSLHRSVLPSTARGIKKLKSERTSTPKSISSNYPSIEAFRDGRHQELDWSFVPRRPNSPRETGSLLSLSDICPEATGVTAAQDSEDDDRTVQRSASFPQTWSPAGVRHRSFVKMAPLPVSVDRPSTVTAPQAVADDGEDRSDSNSYTSIGTWTTATGTHTATAHTDVEMKPREATKRTAVRRDSCGSPTLVLRSYLQHNLHSTAIRPTQDIRRLQTTPQLSPIKLLPGDARQRTPSVPTHNVSPRGPRKSQSFLSMPTRSAPAKCSTMLFSSPLPDAGDAPLDVSSIRMALSDTLNLREAAHTVRENQPHEKARQEGERRDRVLTSTPQGGGARKFMCNLSSVQTAAEDEVELVPLETSGHTVNSQEIVADSWSESSINLLDDQDMEAPEPEQHTFRPVGMAHPRAKPESAIHRDSCPGLHSKVHSHGEGSGQAFPPMDVEDVSSIKRNNPPATQQPEEGWRFRERRGASVQEGVPVEAAPVDGRGDTFRKGPQDEDEEFDSEASGGECENSAERGPTVDVKTETSDSSMCYELSIDDHLNIYSPSKVHKKRKARWRRRLVSQFNQEVDVCPLSALVRTPREVASKPGMRMWMEPPDSGFLDMVSEAPDDIIGLVSKSASESAAEHVTGSP